MWLNVPNNSKLLNLDQYSDICIVTVNEEKGLYELSAFEAGESICANRLTSPCSIEHAKKQLSNIIRSLSKGVKVCRVYDEDETSPQDTDDND